jgi:SH3-like domain-containing protein
MTTAGDTNGANSNYDATVSAAWEATYADVVSGRVGEQVEATTRVEDWRETPGWTWRWCRDRHGREGWIPDALLAINGAVATMREDYSAQELTVTVGTRLTVEREAAGWALCRTPDGATGWAPLECLAPIPMSHT